VLNPKRGGELSDAVCAILNIQWEAVRAEQAVRNDLLGMVESRKAEQAQASSLALGNPLVSRV
jgi:hypothetical protein